MLRLLWVTYASFYLLRVNIAVAVPGIIHDTELTRTQLGAVLSAFFFSYALGQLINGQLGDWLKPRYLIVLGLAGSTAINGIFPFVTPLLAVMIVMWAINGYIQSMGWAPAVRTLSNWHGSEELGRASGVLGTSYIAGSAASWLLASLTIRHLPWQAVFWSPLVLTSCIAIYYLRNGRSTPTLDSTEHSVTPRSGGVEALARLKLTFGTRLPWYAGIALCGLNVVRYGFLSWAPTMLFELEEETVSHAAFKALAFPLAGMAGAILAGRASDKAGKRGPVAFVMLCLLVVACICFTLVIGHHAFWSTLLLLAIGFLTFGPHVLLVGAIPADFGARGASSSVAGFVDAFGYLGAAVTGIVTGFLSDKFGWGYALVFWIAGALLAAGMALAIWVRGEGSMNRKGSNG